MLRTPLLCAMCSQAMALAASFATATWPKPPAGALGPPSHIDELNVGQKELSVVRTDALDGSEIEFWVKRLALLPACFYLRGILSGAECDHLIAAGDRERTQPAMSAGGMERPGCSVAWLDVQQDPVASELAAVVAELLLTPEIRSGWGTGGGFENLQVLRYAVGGEFELHHDANEETPRTLSLLLYLNGKGETWFPLASNDPNLAESSRLPTRANPRKRAAALQALEGVMPGQDGLLVSPNKGDAVAFYNFVDDGSGMLDRFAFHAGMPAKDEKSVAALWYHLGEEASDAIARAHAQNSSQPAGAVPVAAVGTVARL